LLATRYALASETVADNASAMRLQAAIKLAAPRLAR
jgi:hypothetical protein